MLFLLQDSVSGFRSPDNFFFSFFFFFFAEGNWRQYNLGSFSRQIPQTITGHEQASSRHRLFQVLFLNFSLTLLKREILAASHPSISSAHSEKVKNDWSFLICTGPELRLYPRRHGIVWRITYKVWSKTFQVFWLVLETLWASRQMTTARQKDKKIPHCITDSLTDVRQSLAAPRLVGSKDGSGQGNLADLLQTTHSAQVEQIKSVLANLQVRFLHHKKKVNRQVYVSEITEWSVQESSRSLCLHFAGVHSCRHHICHEAVFPRSILHPGCARRTHRILPTSCHTRLRCKCPNIWHSVFSGWQSILMFSKCLMVSVWCFWRTQHCMKDHKITRTIFLQEFCDGTGEKGSAPPALLLILSRLCADFENSTISYLVG